MASPSDRSDKQPETGTNQNNQQPETDTNQNNEQPNTVVGRKRKKTSTIWEDFDEETKEGVKKAVCKYCKSEYATGGSGASTSHMRRHIAACLKKKMHESTQKKQATIPFQPSKSGGNPFITPGARYSNEKMREILATAIMVHEYPFSVVEDDILMWAFEYANPDFRKFFRKTTSSDCVALFENEKKELKKLLESVSKISLTTDMWKSSHQVVEYMVITGHFIDAGWNLQKRVLSFVKVPAPRRGIDVADAIYKCLKSWGIENKVFSVSVDNASYNDSCLRYLKDYLSLSSKLILDGSLFHVRCCAHILNLLVQDGLSKIKDIIFNVRESVKYINHNEARLKAFCDVVEQRGLKERKLIIDCPTRWNSTFNMLSIALKFKIAFAAYKEREPHYDLAPSPEEWNKVEKVCKLLEVFNRATHVISGSEYPTANLYLSEVWKVKQILDNADEDADLFMREMANPMKIKFDKYWGECNLLMSIASVLDPRCKFHMVRICFPTLYKSKEVADANIKKVKCSLEQLYDEYVALSLEESSATANLDSTSNPSSSQANVAVVRTGFDEIMSIIQENEAIPPKKSELQDYLDEGLYVPNSTSFCALDWWRNNSMKYKILSKMAADILAIPISTVASESTFSAGGRVIDERRTKLSEDSVEALICGADWFRHKYNVKKKLQVEKEETHIILKI
ncbi:unnamed protein product [Trifolium pratense]|uniref:Uncharacterized protein n=1 Tax=Trifolium pratense TaxID=57577 RepID=A0ACB0JHZ7_TRIPR|nr:unnamed protein product [Trifolium pratense]